MSESKFLKCILLEGIFLCFLGLFVLLAPKITELSFGFSLCIAYLVYGGFKTISAFVYRHISNFYFIDIVTGIIISFAGILLFFLPFIDIMFILSLIGIYLILQSLSSSALSVRVKTTFKPWGLSCFAALLELFFGIIVIITLSPASLWLAGILTGIDFLIKGIILINLRLSEEYKHLA